MEPRTVAPYFLIAAVISSCSGNTVTVSTASPGLGAGSSVTAAASASTPYNLILSLRDTKKLAGDSWYSYNHIYTYNYNTGELIASNLIGNSLDLTVPPQYAIRTIYSLTNGLGFVAGSGERLPRQGMTYSITAARRQYPEPHPSREGSHSRTPVPREARPSTSPTPFSGQRTETTFSPWITLPTRST